MMQVLDGVTGGGLSVAYRIALRSLTPEEVERVKRLDRQILERATRTLSRIRFADQLRYTIAQSITTTDIRDALQGFDRDALEVYLLCTCLDTLAGKDDFIDLPSWLKTDNRAYHGIAQRDTELETAFAQPLERARYLPLIETILNLYHQHFGVTKGIRDMVQALPEYIKEGLSRSYRIHKQNQNENTWNNKTTEQKIKLIVDYLVEVRRNRYTHSANTPPTIGKIKDARTRLLEGNAQLPPPENATISWRSAEFTITCNHGDDALFVRELVYVCIAHRYELLDENWLSRFRDTERQYRVLQAFIYELEYNIRIIQYHKSTLFEGFAFLDGKLPPHFRTQLATSLLNRDENLSINFAPQLLAPFLEAYLESITNFNKVADEAAGEPHAMLDIGDTPDRLRIVYMIASNLMWEYPRWAYDKDYVYDFSSL